MNARDGDSPLGLADRMEYRRLGASGLRVSVLGLGSWISFDEQMNSTQAMEVMQTARDCGCNFFDNAEVYAGGRSEAMMGKVLRELGWPRYSFVITTKFFWGLHRDDPNMVNTLNRKYLRQAIEGSLERLGLDFVDVAYCHRPDPHTPIAETVEAMSEMVLRGQANYWGTSQWSAYEIGSAINYAQRNGLIAPVTEQTEYNLFNRNKVDIEYQRLFADTGYGNTTWSPLASGLLSGKYKDGIPDDSRAAEQPMIREQITEAKIARVERLRPIAGRLDCTVAQLAIAWAAKHPMVSSVITGASRPSQVIENFDAIDLIGQITSDVRAEIERAIGDDHE